MSKKRSRPSWPSVRDGILFFSGLAGLAYEVLFKKPPDYGFLPIFGGMIGLPAFLRRDIEARREHDDDDDDSSRSRSDNALPGG